MPYGTMGWPKIKKIIFEPQMEFEILLHWMKLDEMKYISSSTLQTQTII